MGLIPEADLIRARQEYEREHPTPAQVLVRTAQENPGMTVAELALTLSRSRSWVRKILREERLRAAGLWVAGKKAQGVSFSIFPTRR